MELDIRELARKGLQTALAHLDAERTRLRALLADLDAVPSAARGAAGRSARRPRQMSPEGRQRIQEAVRRRWERARAAQAAAAVTDGGATPAAPAPADSPAPVTRTRRRTTPPRSGGRKK